MLAGARLSDHMSMCPVDKAHRLLAPRVAYLIGSHSPAGEPNVIPVSNVTSVSTKPQQVLLAILKRWQTHHNLLNSEGFTLSVPRIEHLDGVWKLGARYSHFPITEGRAKIAACGLTFDADASPYGPVLPAGVGWLQCRIISRTDLGGDHGIFVGEVEQVHFNSELLDPTGVPQTATNALMQITGNKFTTSSGIQEIPLFSDDE